MEQRKRVGKIREHDQLRQLNADQRGKTQQQKDAEVADRMTQKAQTGTYNIMQPRGKELGAVYAVPTTTAARHQPRPFGSVSWHCESIRLP